MPRNVGEFGVQEEIDKVLTCFSSDIALSPTRRSHPRRVLICRVPCRPFASASPSAPFRKYDDGIKATGVKAALHRDRRNSVHSPGISTCVSTTTSRWSTCHPAPSAVIDQPARISSHLRPVAIESWCKHCQSLVSYRCFPPVLLLHLAPM
jgi:hypothetical protein